MYLSRKLCLHKTKQGCRGRSPLQKKDDVILRARPQTAWRPKDLVPTELFLGRRGAITKWSALHPPVCEILAPKLHSDHHTSD